MRRNVILVLTVALTSLAVSGCHQPGKKSASTGFALTTADSVLPSMQETDYGSEAYSTLASPTPVAETYEPSAPVTRFEPQYHTVAKSETLYGLARTYYGDHHRWKAIYEANRSTISDPNSIQIGQRLLIP